MSDVMMVAETALPGVVLIEPDIHRDERGFFLETFQVERYRQLAGIDIPFVQQYHARSPRGVLRGLHGQRRQPQGKLVRVSRGRVFDVAVDVNPGSATFGQWYGAELSEDGHRQMYVPPGCLHGVLVLSEIADIEYLCTAYYDPADEIGLLWDDPAVGIDWPLDGFEPMVLPKDRSWPALEAYAKRT